MATDERPITGAGDGPPRPFQVHLAACIWQPAVPAVEPPGIHDSVRWINNVSGNHI